MAALPAARVALKTVLWSLLLCCVACFLLVTFMRPTKWYISNEEFTYIRGNTTLPWPNPNKVPVLTTIEVKKGKPSVVNVGKDAALWAGGTVFPVTLQWGSVMLAALAITALQYMRTKDTTTSPTYVQPNQNTWAAVKCSISHIIFHQLPPRQLWMWWCGGLNVMDACLVATWIGLTVLYLYYNISRKFEAAALSLTPSPQASSPLPPPPPTPMPPGVNATSPPPVPKPVDISYEFAVDRLEAAAKSFGETLRMLLMLMFFPVSRSSFLQYMFKSDFSSLIKYHRWMSWGTIFVMTAHGVLYMTLWGSEAVFQEELSADTQVGQRNIAGVVALLAALAIAFTATTWFRTHYFQIFYSMHIGGFVVFILFALMHYKGMVSWILPSLLLYGLDRAFRYWQLAGNWTFLNISDAHIDGSILSICLTFHTAQHARIQPGQVVYLRVPRISLFHSHPFSVADVCEEGDVTRVNLHMRAAGQWTTQLSQRLQQGQSLRVQLEGPYDSSLEHVIASSPPLLVIIAGGIGVTPVLGLLRQYARTAIAGKPVPKLHFLWTSRALCELRLLGADLLAASAATAIPAHKDSPSSSGASSPLSCSAPTNWLHTTLHYTGFEHEQAEQQAVMDIKLMGKTPSFLKQTSLASHPEGTNTPTRPLSLHPARYPILAAACTLLTFFGAWAGLLAASYYDGYWARTTKEGANYLLVGFLQFLAISGGAILPPFVLLAITGLVTRKHLAATLTTPPKQTKAAPITSSSSLTVLPGYVLAAADQHGEVGTLQLLRGRPKIDDMLQDIRQQYNHLSQIHVLVAGPESMYQAVVEATSRGTGEGPVLVTTRVAHHH